MHTITYTSTAYKLFSEEDLLTLLKKSRDNNAQFGVTGLLLYHDGSFIQTIEGNVYAIKQLYDNICRDESHHSIIKMVEETLETRNFPDWHMGFSRITDKNMHLLKGFSTIFQQRAARDSILGNESFAKELLYTFRYAARN